MLLTNFGTLLCNILFDHENSTLIKQLFFINTSSTNQYISRYYHIFLVVYIVHEIDNFVTLRLEILIVTRDHSLLSPMQLELHI